MLCVELNCDNIAAGSIDFLLSPPWTNSGESNYPCKLGWIS